MAFQYLPAPSVELRQGEILAAFYEYRPEKPVAQGPESAISVIPIIHNRVILITQDCDLKSDHLARSEENHQHRNILRCLILCELFEASEIRDPAVFGTKEWRQVRQNQNERYHCFPAAGIGDGSTGQLPELVLDFKRIVPACTEDLYDAIRVGQTQRAALVPDLFIHDLIHRFFSFHARIALPIE